MSLLRLLTASGSTLLLGACAAQPASDPPPAPGPGPLRVMVRLAAPLTDAAAIAAAATTSAGRPVRYVAASGSDWHALIIDCSAVADCSVAVNRLRADTQQFAAVEYDGRKRIVSPNY